ncbi:helix-turn-helix domain-containing protein [Mastigocoleus testarum]|uniref:HTH cro/C1-type domain-containing protein n=1 Tax=Mastigocoleus testarum BC008 TaxID=371196 RepID=A0A0V8A0Y1_9CYAN|nr:helix-turn-helix domain-containing protein [Mastigocoleus testarum]KST70363.1 hypothetical protein BC008_45015 [Mastigocoleus testarum BC008]
MSFYSFPQNLKIARKQNSYSQEQLAFESNLATRTIQLYEKGCRYPSIKNLIKLSQTLGVRACQLYPELANINIYEIIREKYEREVQAVKMFIENKNLKDLEKFEQMFKIFKKFDTIDDYVDCELHIHQFLLKYTSISNKIIAKRLMYQSYQELYLNIVFNNSIIQKFGCIYFDVHCKLFQAILDRKESIIFSQYRNHLETEENILSEYLRLVNDN